MTRARPDRWLWGIPALVAIWAGSLFLALPAIETALRTRVLDGSGVASGEVLTRSGVRVAVDGRDVEVVTDVGLPPDVARAVVASLGAIPGVRRVSIATPPAVALDPFTFTVRVRPDGLRLTGGVPSPDLHAALIDAARGFTPAGRIDDRLRLATGAAPDFAPAAERLVRLAGLLERGELSLTGSVLSVAGDARDFAAYNALRDALAMPVRGFAPAELSVRPPVASPFVWSAGRTGDVVTLEGFVPSEPARAAALAAARAAVPRGSVVDRTQTARGLDQAVPFESVAGTVLGALGQLQSGSARLEGRTLALAGASPARDVLSEVGQDLRKALPSGVSLGRLDLAAVPADPFRLLATRADNRVSLSGYVPDRETRERLLAVVARRFPGEALVTQLHVADGAPPGFAAVAENGLAALAELAGGTLAVTGRDVRLTGRILYAEEGRRLAAGFASVFPAGWSASAELDGPPPERALDLLQCGDLLADALRRQPIRFDPGTAALPAATRPALDGALAVLRRCGPVRLRLVATAASGSDEDRVLAQARAEGAAALLAGAGLARGTAVVVVAEGPGGGRSPDRLEISAEAP